MAEFAIGDIHGCATAFRLIVDHIKAGQADTVVLLGDYVDRGPDSCGVLEAILELSSRTTVIPLQGNHEIMLQRARLDPNHYRDWIVEGGAATLDSYRRRGFGTSLDSIPEKHWALLREQTLDYWESDHAIYVHATVDPNLEMADQPDFLLFWQPFHNPTIHISGKPIVCGHTPQKGGLPAVFDRGVCIDTWAHGGGWLTCYDLSRRRFVQFNEEGRSREFDLSSIADGENT